MLIEQHDQIIGKHLLRPEFDDILWIEHPAEIASAMYFTFYADGSTYIFFQEEALDGYWEECYYLDMNGKRWESFLARLNPPKFPSADGLKALLVL